jgi:hypothetical protein
MRSEATDSPRCCSTCHGINNNGTRGLFPGIHNSRSLTATLDNLRMGNLPLAQFPGNDQFQGENVRQ